MELDRDESRGQLACCSTTRPKSPLAGDSEALVTKIADKLLGGQISATLKAEAKAAVERVPATNAGQRVAEALYLVATSPEYVVQR